MHPMLTDKLGQLADLCERVGIDRLEAFGPISGNGEPFDPATDAIDLLISQESPEKQPTYFDVLAPLEEIFGRPVAVVWEQSIRDAGRRASIDAERKVIYDAADARGSEVVGRRTDRRSADPVVGSR